MGFAEQIPTYSSNGRVARAAKFGHPDKHPDKYPDKYPIKFNSYRQQKYHKVSEGFR